MKLIKIMFISDICTCKMEMEIGHIICIYVTKQAVKKS